MIKDARFVFASGQDVTAVTNSQRAIDLQASSDFGVGRPFYVVVQCRGALTNDLRTQVIGSDSSDFSEVSIIADSGVKEAADLTTGTIIKIPVIPADVKYRYMALRFIPSASGSPSTGTETPTGSAYSVEDGFDDLKKVGEELTEIADAVDAWGVIGVAFDVGYEPANAEKITAG